jgi:hypothetical protein
MDRSVPTREESDKGLEVSRRNFLKEAGKFAAYTPPAMLVLMRPSANAIAGSPGGGGKPKHYKGPKRYKGPKGYKAPKWFRRSRRGRG